MRSASGGSMTKAEISGYVQIVIGAVGIIITILTSPTMLDAIGQIGNASSLPPEFSGASGAIRIFSVLFVLFAFTLLVMIGLAIVLAPVFQSAGSARPFLTAFFGVAAMTSLAVTATLAILSISYWVAGFVGAGTLIWLSFTAGDHDPRGQKMLVAAVVGSIVFLFVGGATAIGKAIPAQNASETSTAPGPK